MSTCRVIPPWAAPLVAIVAWAASSAQATDFEIHEPTAGGKIVIGFRSLTEICEFISVDIAAGDTAAQKAEKIKNKINSQCGTIFTASVDGSTLTVKNDIHPNQRIFIHIKSDDTGEKDEIRDDVDDFWPWETDGWYEPKGATTGLSRRGDGTQGYLTIGNSRHVAQIPTFPGIPVIELLAMAVFDLHANGVPEAELVDLGDGRGAIILPWVDADEFQQFGVDDSGLEGSFEERPKPLRLDLRANALTVTSSNGGVVDGVINVAGVVGSDLYAPEVQLNWEIHVNGIPHAAGTQAIPVAAGFSCYIQSPPTCNGSCPPGSDGCVHVDWPTDWCGCYFDFDFAWSVPANPGDIITLVVDPAGQYIEDHELNNRVEATVPPPADLVDFEVLNCYLTPGSIPGFTTVNFSLAIHPEHVTGAWLLDIDVLVDDVADRHVCATAKIGPLAVCPAYDPNDPNDPTDPVGCFEPPNACGQLQWSYKDLGSTLNAFCALNDNNNTCFCQYPTVELKKEVLAGTNYVVVLDPDNLFEEADESNNICTVTAAPCPGDIDGDHTVGQGDLGVLLGAFNQCINDPGYVPAADLNQDGCIGQSDLGILLSNWGPCP